MNDLFIKLHVAAGLGDQAMWSQTYQQLERGETMNDSFRAAFVTWQEKTEWVQTDKRFDVLLPWGKHRADVLKEYIEHLESKIIDMAVQIANVESASKKSIIPNEINSHHAYQFMHNNSLSGCYRDGWNDCRATMLKGESK